MRQSAEISVIAAVIQKENAQPPVEETDFKLIIVSPHHPLIRPAKLFPPDYGNTDYKIEISMLVFGADNQIVTH